MSVCGAATIEAHGDRIEVAGALTHDTVVELLERSSELFDGAVRHFTFDLARVGRVDSAGLALLLEWRRRASRESSTLALQNIPKQLLAIAKLSKLDELFLHAPVEALNTGQVPAG